MVIDNSDDNTVRNQKRLPDPEICRMRYLWEGFDFSACLVENPNSCKHAFGFGFGFLCCHPDRRSLEKAGLP
jgi:hypothetical protein